MKFVQCLHNSTEAFRVWFKVVSNDFSEELTYKKKQYPRDMPNCMLFPAVSLKHTKTQWFMALYLLNDADGFADGFAIHKNTVELYFHRGG